MDNNDPKVIDAQIVDDTSTETTQSGDINPSDTSPSADSLLSLTGLIQNYIAGIDRARKELTEHRQLLTDSFMNDEAYRLEEEKVKAATKVRNQVKQQILKQPQLWLCLKK